MIKRAKAWQAWHLLYCIAGDLIALGAGIGAMLIPAAFMWLVFGGG